MSTRLKDRLLLQAHNNLGVSYKKMGMLDEAKREYELSLDIAQRLFGDKNRSVAGALINLGNIYYSKGDIGGGIFPALSRNIHSLVILAVNSELLSIIWLQAIICLKIMINLQNTLKKPSE